MSDEGIPVAVRCNRPTARWRRAGVLIAVAGLMAGLVVTVTPGAASAGAIVPCPAGITEWRRAEVAGRVGMVRYEGYRYTLVSATPRFAVSDGRALDNGTDTPVVFTVQSTVSRTHQVSVTVGVAANNVLDFLTSNVSTNIVSTRTTSIGVTFNTTVPARTRLIAEYGVEVYDVSYYIEAWRSRWQHITAPLPGPGSQCEEWGFYPQSTVAPTVVETWRLRTG